MIKTIAFDFNGTMFFDTALQRQAWGQMLKQTFNHQMTEAEFFNDIAGRNNQYTFDLFVDQPLPANKVATLADEKEALYRQICLEQPEIFHLAPGLPAFLDRCHDAGIKVNIATASQLKNVEFFFDHLNLSHWFDFDQVVINDDSLPGKPAPDMYLQALKHIGGVPATSMILEDSLSGIQAANNAKAAQTVLVHAPEEAIPAMPAGVKIDQTITDYHHLFETL
ncbi:HAD family hydrolase [Lactiplantibacillus songbeiensis]|uniref:HAD family hydrolase n=1 Tax=Lactiplantibacillus songbeiensis TaxID=2559920 RepID=A0ABW4BZS8_9LACO|nr:HAD family phosphatase [Lactiplantibacillus songbeiensis]